MTREDLSGYQALISSLDKGLLATIPSRGSVQFETLQVRFYDSLPEKLLIGYLFNSPSPIYACWRQFKSQQRINFLTVDNGKGKTIKASSLVRHSISDPFRRTYLKRSTKLDPASGVRFTILVKWYFIAAGFANCGMLTNVADFKDRLSTALQWMKGYGLCEPNSSLGVTPRTVQTTSTGPSSSILKQSRVIEEMEKPKVGTESQTHRTTAEAVAVSPEEEEEQDLVNKQMALEEHITQQKIEPRLPSTCSSRTGSGPNDTFSTASSSAPSPSSNKMYPPIIVVPTTNGITLDTHQHPNGISRQAGLAKRKRTSFDWSPVEGDRYGATKQSDLNQQKINAIATQSFTYARSSTSSQATCHKVEVDEIPAGNRTPNQTTCSYDEASAECDLTKTLLEYLLPELGKKHDEESLLKLVETAWNSREKWYEHLFGELNACRRMAFALWISERRGRALLRLMQGRQMDVQERKGREMYASNNFKRLEQQWKALRDRHNLQDQHLDDFVGETMAAITGLEESDENKISEWFRDRLRWLRSLDLGDPSPES